VHAQCIVLHCSTNILPDGLVQLAIRHSWLSSLLARLAREIGLESLPLATVPQRFPCRVGSYFPHAAAHGCGFVMVDNVRGSDAITPGRCCHCARSGLASTQEVICSHSPSKGSLWVRRQPRTRFLLSCSRYRVWIVADGSGTLFSTRSDRSRSQPRTIAPFFRLDRTAIRQEYHNDHNQCLRFA